jgi:heme iron utilization protein
MPSRLDTLLDLLHTTDEAALATHSVALPGFPFASSLPFVPDAGHCPVFLISRLAEHTQNLLKDSRASVLLRKPGSGAEIVRATLVGEVEPIESDPLLEARYLRYQPAAERLLQFGDFAFFRLRPQRVRIIGGFAQASWLDGERLSDLPSVSLNDEAAFLQRFAGTPRHASLLGIDAFGIDVMTAGRRQRRPFSEAPIAADALDPAVAAALSAFD